MKHCLLSPSAVSRWSRCPASVALTQSLGQKEETNARAEFGTLCHEVAEKVLRGMNFKEALGENKGEAHQIISKIEAYVAYVQEAECHKDIELKVLIEQIKGWGYSDCVLYWHKPLCGLEIIDLKTGRIEVEAESNEQLMLYAVGVMQFYPLGDFEIVKLTIIQNNKISSWCTTAGFLKEKAKKFETAANDAYKYMDLIKTKEGIQQVRISVKDGVKQCTYCEYKPQCPRNTEATFEFFD